MGFRIAEILDSIGKYELVGSKDETISKIIPLHDLDSSGSITDAMCWIGDKYVDSFPAQLKSKLGLLVLTPLAYEKIKGRDINYLVVENPRFIFAEILKLKFAKVFPSLTEPSASVSPEATIGKNCYIGRNVVIEKKVTVGNNSVILHNTVILENTVIGDNVIIGCNCSIGNFGFGYEKNQLGQYQLIEHLGRVVISNHVHIHNNTCIDRGVLGETFIGENVKIDNLVHVAHGVTIGKNSLVIANTMLGGSVNIGEDCWIAPSATIKNKVEIADNTLAGLGCVILKNTEPNSTMIGNPAIKMEEYKKWSQLKEQLFLNFNTDLK